MPKLDNDLKNLWARFGGFALQPSAQAKPTEPFSGRGLPASSRTRQAAAQGKKSAQTGGLRYSPVRRQNPPNLFLGADYPQAAAQGKKSAQTGVES